MLASELFAISQSTSCKGDQECHWCSAPCNRGQLHDDDPPMIGIKRNAQMARRPGNPWICNGCRLWRRPRVTINFLNGSFLDGQTARRHSWWITEEGAQAINPEWTKKEDWSVTYQMLWTKILKPPLRFCLALLDGPSPIENHLQLCVANDLPVVKASTLLSFTVNGVVFRYSIYELKEALRRGQSGKEPGVGELIRLLGSCDLHPRIKPEDEERKPGPPIKSAAPLKEVIEGGQ